jgi:hypothetical protein
MYYSLLQRILSRLRIIYTRINSMREEMRMNDPHPRIINVSYRKPQHCWHLITSQNSDNEVIHQFFIK